VNRPGFAGGFGVFFTLEPEIFDYIEGGTT
jgi:hypothetical protein